MQILDGKVVAKQITENLKIRVEALRKKPTLVIFQVGDNQASNKYISSKIAKAKEIGISVELIKYHADINPDDLKKHIFKKTRKVTSAILQLPLPSNMNRQELLDVIPFEKDVDGLAFGNTSITPATPRGIMSLLAFYGFNVEGKKVAIVGQSRLVGQPIARLCEKAGADVITFNKTTGIKGTEEADILIVAAGSPKLIKAENIKQGAVIIDVGINEIADHDAMLKIVGDVDRESIKNKALAVSPVPGGVGPMTVISLMQNIVDAAEKHENGNSEFE